MANDFPGPLSPDELARVQAYFGASQPPAGPPEPVASFGPPAPPQPVDAGPYYNYNPAPDAPIGPPPPPPAPIRPVGAQLSQVGDPQAPAFSGTAPPAPAGRPPAPPNDPTKLGAADIFAGGGGIDSKVATPPKPITAPSGPSAKDDAEFAAFRRLQDTRKAPVGGGGKGNPDPFGVKGATGKLLGTYDAEADAIRHGATAEGDRAAGIAGMRADLARQQMEDAAIHAQEIDNAQKGFDQHMAEVQRQIDDVRAQKIDPNRLMKKDGMGFMAVVGGLVGGLYMGLNKLDHNPFLDDLNKQIDRDIAAQEKDLDTKQRGVSDSMNMLREQRATFKDNDLAKLQTKNAMYEASKNAIEAEAARFDQPMVQARAEQALATVNRAQAGLQKEIADRAQAAAAAGAAQQAAQQRAQAAEMRKAFGDTYEKNIAAGMAPAQAESEASRMVQNLFGGGAGDRPAPAGGAHPDPVSLVPKDQRAQAIKELEEHAKAEKSVQAIDRAFSQWKTTGVTSPRQIDTIQSGIAGAYKAGLGPGMSSDNDFEQFIKPNIPKVGDSTETLALKHRNIVESMRSKIATPTLDTHAPGWAGSAPVPQYNFDGTPKP